MNVVKKLIGQDYTRTKNNETLAHVLSKLIKNDDDIAFVFNKDTYVGAFQSSHLFKKRLDFTTMKVHRVLQHPANIQPDMDIEQILSLFLTSQATKLPVFDGVFHGIISVESVLKELLEMQVLEDKSISHITSSEFVYLDEHERIDSSLEYMRYKGLDYITVLDKDLDVIGYVTYLDAYKNFYQHTQPKDTGHRSRISTKGFSPQNINLYKLPVSNIMTDHVVVSVSETASMADVASTMLKYGILHVYVKKDHELMNVVSVWDVFRCLDEEKKYVMYMNGQAQYYAK